jgi:hypothetical protein
MKASIVVTSINDCTELLNGYLSNFAKYGREASIYLIPDRKTPPQKIPKGIKFISFIEQERFLSKNKFPADWREDIPWNSDNRRNVGYLMALADGSEVVISIDDDNYCPEDEDFIGEHTLSLRGTRGKCIRTTSGWFNNCFLMTSHRAIFPRGYPYSARNLEAVNQWEYCDIAGEVQVRLNGGMWSGDPDMDAMTWLSMPTKLSSRSDSAILAPDTWCPINSQNTAVHRDLMPAYYFIRMVSPNDRFGDIFQGYFALKVAKHFGWTARFGSPVVTHRRNSHVYLKDVQKEIEPIILLEELLPKLLEAKLSGSTVHEAYLCLADFVESQSSKFYSDTARLMRLWANSCRVIG